MLDSRLRGNDFALGGNPGARDDDRGECVHGPGFSVSRERLPQNAFELKACQ